MGYKLSPSAISLMKNCPRCFWMKLRKNFKRPSGPFPSLPSGMDKILKVYFDSFRKKGSVPSEVSRMDKNLKLFADTETLKEWRKTMKGLIWEDGQGNVIFGGLDDVFVKNGKLVVTDYKTGGYPPKDTLSTRYKAQLEMYSFLLRKNGEKTENYGYILYYHPLEVQNSAKVKFNIVPVKVRLDIKNAESDIRKALSLLKKKIPKPSSDCEYCDWGSRWGSQEEEMIGF